VAADFAGRAGDQDYWHKFDRLCMTFNGSS
jgi:hypothetical protein